MSALTPLSGTYLVGVVGVQGPGRPDVTFERQVQTVTREVLEPVETDGDKSIAPEQMQWTARHARGRGRDLGADGERPEVRTAAARQPRGESRRWPAGRATVPMRPSPPRWPTSTLRGVDGPVQFLLTDATYPTETFPITVNVTGGAPTRHEHGDLQAQHRRDHHGRRGQRRAARIFKVLNTNYITIDGSNAENGTTRDLTLENTSATSPTRRLVRLERHDADHQRIAQELRRPQRREHQFGRRDLRRHHRGQRRLLREHGSPEQQDREGLHRRLRERRHDAGERCRPDLRRQRAQHQRRQRDRDTSASTCRA